jgi:3-oxoacyl-ACP reductase-like protein
LQNRTLASGKYPLFPQKELLAFCRDKDAIYYKNGSTEEQQPQQQAPQQPAPARPAPAQAPAPAPAPAPAHAPSQPRAAVADAPVSAMETLQVVLASKLHRQLNEITPDKSIKVMISP